MPKVASRTVDNFLSDFTGLSPFHTLTKADSNLIKEKFNHQRAPQPNPICQYLCVVCAQTTVHTSEHCNSWLFLLQRPTWPKFKAVNLMLDVIPLNGENSEQCIRIQNFFILFNHFTILYGRPLTGKAREAKGKTNTVFPHCVCRCEFTCKLSQEG